MNKKQNNAEQQIKLMKFDCEMRAKAVELAATLSGSNSERISVRERRSDC